MNENHSTPSVGICSKILEKKHKIEPFNLGNRIAGQKARVTKHFEIQRTSTMQKTRVLQTLETVSLAPSLLASSKQELFLRDTFKTHRSQKIHD